MPGHQVTHVLDLLDRLGTPADIAEVVAFLTSPAGHWVNGQRVRANGGLV
jgi:3-oxoacyl-[acyl-carrier protein] reductase